MKRTIRSIRLPARRGLRTLGGAAVVALVVVGAALATGSDAAVAPGTNSPPTISGAATVGSTLSANPGTWTGSTPVNYQYQWMRCDTAGSNCHAIGGATAQTYQLASADLGTTARVQVIASNSDGSANATSDATATIAAATQPASTALPTISGSAIVGSTLTASTGNWSGSAPLSYQYQWLSCDASGANCHAIGSATSQTYQAQSGDTGSTVRVQVSATNPAGSASATSSQTATVAVAAGSSTGCPSAAQGSSVAATAIASPARLQVTMVSNTGVVTTQTQSFSATFRVTDTCGQPVSGAQVYATAVPYNQFAIPPQQTSDASGNVTLIFSRLAGFPAIKTQKLLVIFVRATRSGDPLLAGISTRRLVSLPVNLHG